MAQLVEFNQIVRAVLYTYYYNTTLLVKVERIPVIFFLLFFFFARPIALALAACK